MSTEVPTKEPDTKPKPDQTPNPDRRRIPCPSPPVPPPDPNIKPTRALSRHLTDSTL